MQTLIAWYPLFSIAIFYNLKLLFFYGNSRLLRFTFSLMTNYNSYILFIHFSPNNILFTLTKLNGELIKTITSGSSKSVGVKKISLTSIKTAVSIVAVLLHKKIIHIKCQGTSRFKRLIFKLLLKIPSLTVLTVCDLTALPHNGVRKPKVRRV